MRACAQAATRRSRVAFAFASLHLQARDARLLYARVAGRASLAAQSCFAGLHRAADNELSRPRRARNLKRLTTLGFRFVMPMARNLYEEERVVAPAIAAWSWACDGVGA
jgi:hypothetical protein